jgi:hypothetical protein
LSSPHPPVSTSHKYLFWEVGDITQTSYRNWLWFISDFPTRQTVKDLVTAAAKIETTPSINKENRLGEEELGGLREDKRKAIRSFAKFLAEDAA